MPEMDGLTATKIIRNSKSEIRNPDIPIIAMTAHAMKGERERCLEAGMNGYVSKPIQPKALFKALETVAPASKSEGSQGMLAPGPETVFNMEEALETVGGDHDLLRRIIDMFFETGPGLVEAVEQALENKDPTALRQTAHKLKGTVGNFGAQAAFEAAFQMEKIGDTDDLSNGAQAFRNLQNEIGRLNDALKAFRKKGA